MKEHNIRRFGQGDCQICGQTFWKRREEQFTCSKGCASTWRMQQPAIKKKITTGGIKALEKHRKEHGVWNKGKPWSEEMRLKMSLTHKNLDHSHLTGGNGTGGSWAENLLRTVLPDRFQQEYILRIPKKIEGIPTHYKLDFGDPVNRIAVEVQGQSHSTHLGKVRDKKKRDYLNSQGWSVLYITNTQVALMFGIST